MIKEINIINFGKFKNKKFIFDRGLNVIYGENESGKTTILNFIIMVFYGNNSKSKDLLQNQRNKYRPWNEERMQGNIIIQKEGFEYRIERSFNKSNATDFVKIYNNITGKEIHIENNNTPGNYFFGMSEDTFRKTLFISSEDIIISNDSQKEEITKKLMNIVSTGKEDISYKKALKNINTRLEEIESKNGKKGILIELETKLNKLRNELEIAKEYEVEKDRIKGNISKLENKIKENEIILDDLYSIKDMENQKNEIHFKKNLLQQDIYKYNVDSKDEKLKLLKYKKEEINKKVFFNFQILDLSILLLILPIFGIFNSNIINILITIFSILGFCISFYIKYLDKKEKQILIEDEIKNLELNITQNKKNIERIREEIYYLDNAKKEIEYVINNRDIYSEIEEKKEDIFKYKEEIAKIISKAQEKFRGKENYSTIENKIKKTLEDISKIKIIKNNLILTKDIIKKSFEEVEVDFSSLINDKASEIIKEITNGKYEKITISNDFEINFVESKTKSFKNWRYLSSGTIDQFYISLRLAIVSILVKEKSQRILLLDDIFMRFDNKRKNKLMEFIKENIEMYEQILLFVNKKEEIFTKYIEI